MPCATARTWSPWMITLISHRQAGLEVPRLTLDGQVVQDRNARTGGRRALDAVVTVVALLGTDRDRDGVVGRIGAGVHREIGRASCRDRECQYVHTSVVAGCVKKTTTT